MGFVYAVMPMIFQLGGMLFATRSDFWGRKPFLILHGLLAVVSNLIYYTAHTSMQFLSGKIVEGTKDGALCAVNRSFLMERSENKWRILVSFENYGLRFLGYWKPFGELSCCPAPIHWCAIGICRYRSSLDPCISAADWWRKEEVQQSQGVRVSGFPKKTKNLQIALDAFFVMGLSLGFIGNFVFPSFLFKNGSDTETIGGSSWIAALFGWLIFIFSCRKNRHKKNDARQWSGIHIHARIAWNFQWNYGWDACHCAQYC